MESAMLFNIATVAYLASVVLYISYLSFRNEVLGKAATIVTWGGLVMQTLALAMRWIESYQMGIGRVPLTNLYESLVFFTWSTVLIYLIVEWKYRTRAFGAFVMPVAFLALAFINFAGIHTDISPLVPALKSNWLFYHVLISFLGYAAFAVAFAVSMVFLLMDMEDRGPVRDLWIGLGTLAVLAVIGYAMASGKIETLVHLQKRRDELTKALTKYCESTIVEDLRIVTSIDGINNTMATTLLAEIGQISNYFSHKHLIAFAGIDPTVYQSGKYEGTSRISKSGNRHLRRVIWLMAISVIQHNPIFRKYFMKRRNEGYPFKKAVFATAHKLIRIIFAMLSQRTYFRVKEV